MTATHVVDCYDYPQYWDLAFREDTKLEATFIEAATRKFCKFPVRRLCEAGCGGGRLVVELAARGFALTALDQNAATVAYVQKRLRRRKLTADILLEDMADFQLPSKVDAAFCLTNTFRHLTSESQARSHLRSMARNLRKGGIYILGFHLYPPEADLVKIEKWSAKHGKTHVDFMLRALEYVPEKRYETLRFFLRVRSGQRNLKLQSDYRYRTYTARQFRRLLKSVPEFKLLEVFDFWFDIEEPQDFDDELGDAVFVLRKQ